MKRILAIIALLFSVHLAHGQNTIAYQKSVFDTVPMFTNSGGTLDSSFTFELGTFSGITPTLGNMALWQSDWKLLSVANWNPADQSFGNIFNFNSDGTVSGLSGSATFVEGEQAYLWVKCNDEWALVTDLSGADSNSRWMLPSMTTSNSGAFVWELPTADNVVMGGVNGIQSGTPYSYDPGTNFRLQTAVVPEPGSAMIALLGVAFVVGRRARTQL